MTLHGYTYSLCVVLYIDTSCSNCGVWRPTDGLCARCLDLPYCKLCKRHLPVCCFDGGPRNICQVHLHIILFLHVTYRLYKLDYYFYRYTFSRLCLQNCQKRRTKRYTALNNVASETSLPVTQFDTSFELLINTRQQAIQHIVRDVIQQHGYTNAFVLL